MLGYKVTEGPYTSHDRDLLRAISVQAAVHLELISRFYDQSTDVEVDKVQKRADRALGEESLPQVQEGNMNATTKRFRVAFSFAGEKRSYVARVAAMLAERFGEEAILYDKFHAAEFARRDLGFRSAKSTHRESDLVVVGGVPGL